MVQIVLLRYPQVAKEGDDVYFYCIIFAKSTAIIANPDITSAKEASATVKPIS